jgi:putative FmdB family regulatory protein
MQLCVMVLLGVLDMEGRGNYIVNAVEGGRTVPIYEYQCTKCGRALEVMQKITEEPMKKCPTCKGLLRRLISHTSFHLKGSGWYATDYKDKKNKKGKTADKEEIKVDKKSEEASTA